jgi:glycine/D-amino acid oxidase-like deaminating enzyme
MKTSVEVVVVGGGVIGSAIAFELAKRGMEVLLLEKGSLAGKASSAAAGMLGVHAEIEDEGAFYQFARKSRDRFPGLVEELRDRIANPLNLSLIIEQSTVPVIVDAGIGSPADAAFAMELRRMEFC